MTPQQGDAPVLEVRGFSLSWGGRNRGPTTKVRVTLLCPSPLSGECDPARSGMKLVFAAATNSDAAALAALHTAVAEDLTRRFGPGGWSSGQTERGVLSEMRKPKFSRIVMARCQRRIIGALRLATKKPWAINTAHFTPACRPLYLTGMAVHPDFQRQGVGRLLMKEAEAVARAWPADAIRLDAFDAKAGGGGFYAKYGFREVARVTYKKCPLVYFELTLPPAAGDLEIDVIQDKCLRGKGGLLRKVRGSSALRPAGGGVLMIAV